MSFIPPEVVSKAKQMDLYTYDVAYKPPPQGKDYNDFLCMRLGKPITKTAERNAAR